MSGGHGRSGVTVADEPARIAAAGAAATHAHAPYSRFPVGAAVLLRDGTIMPGANVENASYGLSLCAETVAGATASAAGRSRATLSTSATSSASASPPRSRWRRPRRS